MLIDERSPEPPARLVRSLGVLGVLFLTLSVTTPASSVFVIVPGMLQVAGTGAVWALLLAGIVCVATALIYAELSSAWPVSGGEYVAVAHTLGPLAGFVMLGVNVFNNIFFVPVAALGISAVLSTVIPGLPQVPVAIAVVVGSTLVAVLRIRINAWMTGIFLLFEVLALVVVAVLGFDGAARGAAEFLTAPVVASESGNGLVPTTLTQIGLATSIAIFALNGYGSAVYFGEEMHDAKRGIARAILAALIFTLLLEVVPVMAGLMGAADLLDFLTKEDPFGMLVAAKGGDTLGGWVAVGVVIAIVNAVIAWVLACARFFYGTARDGAWGRPLDTWLTAIHPRFGSPWIGTLLIGAVGVACCFVSVQLLLILSGTGLLVIYAGICVAAMVGRRTGLTDHAHYRMPRIFYPAAPVLTLIALAGVAWASWIDLEEGRPAMIMTAVQIALSVAYYWFILRKRGPWTAHVPAD